MASSLSSLPALLLYANFLQVTLLHVKITRHTCHLRDDLDTLPTIRLSLYQAAWQANRQPKTPFEKKKRSQREVGSAAKKKHALPTRAVPTPVPDELVPQRGGTIQKGIRRAEEGGNQPERIQPKDAKRATSRSGRV